MFVQIIEGRVADRERLLGQFDRWREELRPGATGYLGTTAGVSDDGRGFAIARFESADAARANSDRSEQGQWWSETAKCFEGDVTFTDSDDVEEFLGGGSDEAGFVQVMKGSADRARMREMDARFAEVAPQWRPDLIGGLRIWTGAETYVEVAYFTNEAEAREGEAKEPPPELAGDMAEFENMVAGIEFLDLRDPWLS